MPKREDERWRNINPHPAYCTCADCSIQIARAKMEGKGTWRRIRLARWFIAFWGVISLLGGIIYFPNFADFLRRVGVKNDAFVQSIQLPLEIFGVSLILLSIFAKRPAKALMVSIFLLVLLLSIFFVWHTPSLKGQAFKIVENWIQRGTGTLQKVTSTATPVLTRVQPPATALQTPPTFVATPSRVSTFPKVTTTSPAGRVNTAQLELLIHQMVNGQRSKYGLPQLTWDERLASIARTHSEDMAKLNYFSHTNQAGEGPSVRAARQGYVCRKDYGSYYRLGIAENIFQGWLYSSITYFGPVPVKNWLSIEEIAQQVVDEWMDSPGHRSNILDGQYDRQGIGVAVSSDEKVLVTQNFC